MSWKAVSRQPGPPSTLPAGSLSAKYFFWSSHGGISVIPFGGVVRLHRHVWLVSAHIVTRIAWPDKSIGGDCLPAGVSPCGALPFMKSFSPRSFDLAPIVFVASGSGSCQACSLTMRAADKWDSARFLSFYLALGLYCAQTLSILRPLAANADRWAQEENTWNSLEVQ